MYSLPRDRVGVVRISLGHRIERVLVKEELTGVHGRTVGDERTVGGDVTARFGVDFDVDCEIS